MFDVSKAPPTWQTNFNKPWTFFTFPGFSAAEVVIVGLTKRAVNGSVPHIYFLLSHLLKMQTLQ